MSFSKSCIVILSGDLQWSIPSLIVFECINALLKFKKLALFGHFYTKPTWLPALLLIYRTHRLKLSFCKKIPAMFFPDINEE